MSTTVDYNDDPNVIHDLLYSPSKNHIFQVTGDQLMQLFDRKKTLAARRSHLDRIMQGVSGLLQKLGSEANSGIMGDSRDLARRVKNFQSNTKPKLNQAKFWDSFKDEINSVIYFVLAILVLISIITGMINDPKFGWVKGVTIFIGILLLVLITSCSDYGKDKRYVEINELSKDEYLPVLRGKAGATQTINIWDLVVGDVVLLQAGDIIPADCIIIENSRNFLVKDETINLGEKEWNEAEKDSQNDPFLFADGQVVLGQAKVVVTCVGSKLTCSRRDPDDLDLSKESPLQQKLTKLANNLTFIGIVSSLIILVGAIILLSIQMGVNKDFNWQLFISRLMDAITLTVILIIVAIPEGLPMVITVSLAFSLKRMYDQDGVLIKDVAKTEILGQATEVCLGKVGILTTEQMTVERFYIQSVDRHNSRKNTLINCDLTNNQIDLLSKNIVFNSSVYIELTRNALYEPIGNGTEVSLFKWLQGTDIAVHELIKQKGKVVLHLPFDSRLRRSIIVVEEQNHYRVYVKGAPEVVLQGCTHYHNTADNVSMLDQGLVDGDSKYLLETIVSQKYCCDNGLRTLAFAWRDISKQDFDLILQQCGNEPWEGLSCNLTFQAFIGLDDPIRPNTEQLVKFVGGDNDEITEENVIQRPRNITMRVISGDHIETVRNLAQRAGIIYKEKVADEQRQNEVIDTIDHDVGYNLRQPVPSCMLADDFFDRCHGIEEDGMPGNLQEFKKLMTGDAYDNLKVIARAQPQHKAAIIRGLREMDRHDDQVDSHQKVIFVGNGIHDVEALGISDVSFSMGGGNALSRFHSTMVLIYDEFKSLAKSILWGRNIYVNIKRFLIFQLTCNFSTLLIVFIGQFYLSESPLNAIQLLWLNLIMDTMAALALATTPPFTKVMKLGAYGNEKLLSKIDWRSILTMTVWNIIIMCVIIFAGGKIYEIPYKNTDQTTDQTVGGQNRRVHMTLIFNTFVYLQFFNMINCRVTGDKDFNVFTRFFCNLYQVFILALIFGIQWSMNTSALFWLFGTAPLSSKHFWSTVVLGASSLLVAFLVKLTPSRWAENYIKPVTDEEDEIGSGSGVMAAYRVSQRKVGSFRGSQIEKKPVEVVLETEEPIKTRSKNSSQTSFDSKLSDQSNGPHLNHSYVDQDDHYSKSR